MTSRTLWLGCTLTALIAHTALGQDAGILIGVADRVDPGIDATRRAPQQLHTYWITYTGGRARQAGRFTGLFIPRSDGFLRMTVTRTCNDSAGKDAVACSDDVWKLPIADPLPKTDPRPDPDPCRYDYVDLTFASPTLFAAREQTGSSDKCEPRGWEWQDLDWAESYERGDRLAFGTLGLGAAAAYRDAITHALNVGSEDRPAPPQNDACRAEPADDSGWVVVRANAAWVAHAFQQQGNALCQLEAPVAWPLPASVVGYTEPPLDWQAVTAAVPGAQEAFASPRRDLVLITLATAFRVYALTGGKPGTVLLELPRPKTATQDQIVMVQWALGRSVAAWTQAFAGLR